MARHLASKQKGGVIDILPSGGMVIRRKAHKDLDGGHLGFQQIRKPKNIVSDPRLLKIIGCMASELSGKKPGTLGKAQASFKTARSKCKF
jgi:hypothetical protein